MITIQVNVIGIGQIILAFTFFTLASAVCIGIGIGLLKLSETLKKNGWD